VTRLALCLLFLAIAHPVAAAEMLNVSIVVFDPGVPEQRSVHRDLKIFPRIRAVEAMLLPFSLREALADAGEWGAVRVVPQADEAAELRITGEILHSDGNTLRIRVRAVDAGGQQWIDSVAEGLVGSSRVFDRIAADLHSARLLRTDEDLLRIEEISLLRHGMRIAPSAFGDYLEIGEDGVVEVRRLPAKGDPMFDRIRRTREHEYVITDAVDTRFRELHEEISAVYELIPARDREIRGNGCGTGHGDGLGRPGRNI
jgi:hypothetical protein